MATTGPVAFGLANNGATCWFNALMQALISCGAFMATTPAGALGVFMSQAEKTPAVAGAVLTAGSVLDELRPKFKNILNLGRQEDAAAGFDALIDCAGEAVAAVFKSQWRIDVYCDKCKKIVSRGTDTMMRLTVERDFETLQGDKTLDEFVRGHMSQLVDYKCPACGEVTTGAKVARLINPPDVLVLSYNKYAEKWRSGPRVAEMRIGDRTYRLLAIVQHYGGMSGGHYKAAAARRGVVYTFDDATVTPGGFATTMEDYMMFYG